MTGAMAGPLEGVHRLRAIAEKFLGLRFDDSKSIFLSEILQRRLDQTGRRLEEYLLGFELGEPPTDELRLLAQELTVTETYFFRNVEQLRALLDVALPARARARPGQTLRVLSAGCASGEEPYSLAMLLHSLPQPRPWDVELQAIDVNPAMLKRAEQGRYSAWALRETPADIQSRCFRPQGRDFLLDERLRTLVTFGERNLTRDDPAFWRPEAFDAVFCRNVLMYFSADAAAAVVARLARSLAPGGFLFLGYAETLRGPSQDFHLLHTHGTFYYQRRHAWERPAPDAEAGETSTWIARERASEAPSFVQPLPRAGMIVNPALASPDWPALSAGRSPDTSWVETIRRAAERVESLTQPADEIRKLADRVAGSTKDIRGLVDDVRAAVNATVMATESGSKAVDVGGRQFGDVASSFKRIVTMVVTTTEAAKDCWPSAARAG